MGITILGGVAKGLTLSVPKGDGVRPTAAPLKRKPFDSYQDISDFTFIDLCAGSGAVGLEALSRGASKVVLVENSKKHFVVIKNNVEKISVSFEKNKTVLGVIEVLKQEVGRWIDSFKRSYEASGDRSKIIIFFDPPYDNCALYSKVVSILISEGWYEGHFWVEIDKKIGPNPDFWNEFRAPDKIFEKGDSCIFCYNMG